MQYREEKQNLRISLERKSAIGKRTFSGANKETKVIAGTNENFISKDKSFHVRMCAYFGELWRGAHFLRTVQRTHTVQRHARDDTLINNKTHTHFQSQLLSTFFSWMLPKKLNGSTWPIARYKIRAHGPSYVATLCCG